MLEDSKILELFLVRAEQAIPALEEKYGNACRRIAENILKNRLDAEECVNDAYLALWNTIPPQIPEPLRAYVYRVVRNLSITRYHANTAQKRNSYYDAALEELEPCLASAETVEQALAAEELTRQINAFLATLDEESRMLFVRRYWYADDIAQLAERFQISRNRVSVRLSRIRSRLKRYLQKENDEV